MKQQDMPDGIIENIIENFRKIFQDEECDKVCPFSENIIAYALNELEPEEKKVAQEHLLQCHFCLELFFDMRQTEIKDIKSLLSEQMTRNVN